MKFSLVALISFVSVYFLNAQTKSKTSAKSKLKTGTTKKATTPKKSLLWEVSGNGLEKPSYLFGTFHLMCKEDFNLTEPVKKAFANCEQLFEEMKMDDPSIQLKMLTLMLSKNSLKEQLGEEDFAKVDSAFQKITGMPLLLFNKMKPFAAISMLTQKSISCKETIMPEMEFIQLAKSQQKEVFGLETVEEEMKAIEKLSIDSQLMYLKRMTQNFDSTKLGMIAMQNEYKKRDPDALTKYMKEQGASGDFEVALLVDRNKAWIPVIEKAMKEKPSFFAFGAGHLGGEFGVLNLLKQNGYTLKPIVY